MFLLFSCFTCTEPAAATLSDCRLCGFSQSNWRWVLASTHVESIQHQFSKSFTRQYFFMDVRVGLWRRLSAEELMLLNCGVGEDAWESLGLQGDPTSPFWRRSALDFFGRNDAKAETPVLWPPHAKSWLIGKDSDAGKDWGQEEKGTTEDEMAG